MKSLLQVFFSALKYASAVTTPVNFKVDEVIFRVKSVRVWGFVMPAYEAWCLDGLSKTLPVSVSFTT